MCLLAALSVHLSECRYPTIVGLGSHGSRHVFSATRDPVIFFFLSLSLSLSLSRALLSFLFVELCSFIHLFLVFFLSVRSPASQNRDHSRGVQNFGLFESSFVFGKRKDASTSYLDVDGHRCRSQVTLAQFVLKTLYVAEARELRYKPCDFETTRPFFC